MTMRAVDRTGPRLAKVLDCPGARGYFRRDTQYFTSNGRVRATNVTAVTMSVKGGMRIVMKRCRATSSIEKATQVRYWPPELAIVSCGARGLQTGFTSFTLVAFASFSHRAHEGGNKFCVVESVLPLVTSDRLCSIFPGHCSSFAKIPRACPHAFV